MEVESVSSTVPSEVNQETSNERRDTLGRLLCLSTRKVCQQKRMDGYNFCVKHILEDPNAPFIQCQHTTVYSKQCRNPVSTKDEQKHKHCTAHRTMLGLQPKKTPTPKPLTPGRRRKSEIEESSGFLVPRGTKLAAILTKKGIPAGRYSNKSEDELSSSCPSEEDSDEFRELDSDENELDYESNTFLEPLLIPKSDEKDGFNLPEEDWMLKKREKLLKLSFLYKSQYRRLFDHLSNQHKKLLKTTDTEVKKRTSETEYPGKNRYRKLIHKYHHKSHEISKTEKSIDKCSIENCRGKHMPLSTFCFAHILKDSNQKLFVSCKYVNAQGKACEYPIFTNQHPPYCNAHIDLMDGKEIKYYKKRKVEEVSVHPKRLHSSLTEYQGPKIVPAMSLSAPLMQNASLLSNIPTSPSSPTASRVGIVPSTTDPKVLRETIEKLKQSNPKSIVTVVSPKPLEETKL